jgi:hypothetical protein
MQPLHDLRNGPVGVALLVVQAVGAARTGWCLCGTMDGAVLPPSTHIFWADGPPLHATRTGHKADPQATHRPEKLASNPTPVASNATPCTRRASARLLARFAALSGVHSAFLGLRCPLVPASVRVRRPPRSSAVAVGAEVPKPQAPSPKCLKPQVPQAPPSPTGRGDKQEAEAEAEAGSPTSAKPRAPSPSPAAAAAPCLLLLLLPASCYFPLPFPSCLL